MPPFQPATPQGAVSPPPAPSHRLQDIQDALVHAQSTLPQLLGFLSNFIPQLRAILPFLNLLPVAIQGVAAVQQATGMNTPNAIGVVQAHLTPGQPDAPALEQQAGGR